MVGRPCSSSITTTRHMALMASNLPSEEKQTPKPSNCESSAKEWPVFMSHSQTESVDADARIWLSGLKTVSWI